MKMEVLDFVRRKEYHILYKTNNLNDRSVVIEILPGLQVNSLPDRLFYHLERYLTSND